jgi:hypothetical protein
MLGSPCRLPHQYRNRVFVFEGLRTLDSWIECLSKSLGPGKGGSMSRAPSARPPPTQLYRDLSQHRHNTLLGLDVFERQN